MSKLDDTTDFLDLFIYLGGDWIVPASFYRWAGLSLIAACVEDRVSFSIMEHAPVYPNVWVYLIGGSGTGKDVAIGHAMSFLEPEDPVWRIDGKVTIPALYDYMLRMQKAAGRLSAPVYLISSDVTEQLPIGVEAQDFTSRALGLYGGRDRSLSDITRTSGDKLIHRPLLNWIAGCTPEWFPMAFDPIVFASGAAGRACFVIGQPVMENYHKRQPTRRIDHDLVRTYLRHRITQLQRVEGVFVMNDQASLFYDQWLLQQQERIMTQNLSDVEKNVMNRLRITVVKLAMLFSLSRWPGTGALVIKGKHMSAAIGSLDEIVAGVIAVGDFAYVTRDTAPLEHVRTAIRTAGRVRERELLQLSLRRGVRSEKQFREILDTLEAAGVISIRRVSRGPGAPGPKPRMVIWNKRKVLLTDTDRVQENCLILDKEDTGGTA